MTNYNPFSLEGKTILVTGASSGIGRATAIACSQMGAKVILTARNEGRIKETLSQMYHPEGVEHEYILADLTNRAELDELVAKTPNLDGLVNNAGIIRILPVQFINDEEINKTLSVNTSSPIILTQRLVKKKKMNKGASIVFTSSIAGVFTVSAGHAIYGISKGAINAFMKFSALELASKGIRCNSVNPGSVHTELINEGVFTEEERQRDINQYPMKRYGKPEDIANAIVYLLSDAASWVTGTTLVVDGGYTLR